MHALVFGRTLATMILKYLHKLSGTKFELRQGKRKSLEKELVQSTDSQDRLKQQSPILPI